MADIQRPPKPNGNGWVPIKGGWLNTVTGAMIQPNPNGNGGFTQTSPGSAPQDYSPPPLSDGKPVHKPGGSSVGVLELHTPEHVRAVQRFLKGHGFNLTVDGINGPLTKAAVAAWHNAHTVAARQKAATAFNRAHGLTPEGPTGGSIYTGPANAGKPSGGGGAGNSALPSPIQTLVGMLLKQAGAVGKLIPERLAGQAAEPYTALAATLQQEIDQAPDAKAQALADIGNWYGQSIKSLGKAKGRDKDITDAGVSALQDATSAIVSSLGGSAMPGAGVVGSVGQNGVNELQAEGNAQQQLAEDLGPIFDLAKAGAKTSAGAIFDKNLVDLKGQLAQAQGQGDAARATALAQIIGENNGVAQQDFSNESALLNTLGALQTAGYSATDKALINALRLKRLNAPDPNSFAGASPKSRATVAQQITAALIDPSSHQLIGGMDWPSALRAARNTVRENGWDPLDPTVVKTIIQPALANAGIHFQNPQTLYRP